jgi:hypothetical protein
MMARKSRKRIGTWRILKIGAAISIAPMRVNGQKKSASHWAHCASVNVSIHSHPMRYGTVLNQALGKTDDDAQHPGSERHHHQRDHDQFRYEAQRHLVDLGRCLEHRDDQTDAIDDRRMGAASSMTTSIA